MMGKWSYRRDSRKRPNKIFNHIVKVLPVPMVEKQVGDVGVINNKLEENL
jgi:hypothetical protein